MLEPWRWHTYPELNGLGARCMAEGANGTIWFGTIDGVWNYDGIKWSLPISGESNNIIQLGAIETMCSQTNGTLFLGDRRGIIQFSQDKWIRLFPARGRIFGEIRKLIVGRDGSLWAATAWGAVHYQGSKWTIYTGAEVADQVRTNRGKFDFDIKLLPATLTARTRTNSLPTKRYDFTEVCEDHQGRIWLGTAGGEILCYDASRAQTTAGQWALYNESDGIVCGRSPSILGLQNGTVWATYGAGSGCLNQFDGTTWQATRLADAGVEDGGGNLFQTRDGVVWLSSPNVISAYRDGRWQTYKKPAVPIPTALNSMLELSDGTLWIAGSSTEIQRVEYQTTHWLTLQDLNFEWESPAGTQWFLHRSGRVVVHEGDRWTSYGTEDGLMDAPVALLGTRSGDVWAAGSHENTAATARFAGGKWTRFIHDEFSWGVEWRAVWESADGSVWFGAAVDSTGPKKYRDGILQFHDGVWTHHHQPGRAFTNGNDNDPAELLPATQRPEPIGKFYSMGESRDGKIWAGRNILAFQDGHRWNLVSPPPEAQFGIMETMFTSREKDLWIGTRQFGALRYDGHEWRHFQGKNSLVANSVRSLTQTADGAIWAATDRDFSRFDGQTWTGDLLPAQLNVPHEEGSLKASPSGALWINRFALDWNRRAWTKAPHLDISTCEFWTVCHQFQGVPPLTTITLGPEQVPPSGNLSIFWSGVEPWHDPKVSRPQFSFRLDDQPWSAFTPEQGHSFFSLPGGRHHFEVRARDEDFNTDATPATLDFVVLPAVWRQGWFILLMLVLTGLIVTQSIRVFQEQSRLRRTNRQLAAEIKDREHAEAALSRLNLELDQRVKERTTELELANKELESFSYSVSHDLRTPLRSIDGFSRALLEDYADKLDAEGKENLQTVRDASQRMGLLIDDMLRLAQINRSEMRWTEVDLSQLARQVAGDLKASAPDREVEFVIAADCVVCGDAGLLRIVLENGLGNAWKYTGKKAAAKIEFGKTESPKGPAYFIRDNGCGFDMKYVHKLFGAFQRLHNTSQFPGTGIGLASVQRVIHRHGGQVWIEGKPDQGTTLYFTLAKHPLTL